MVNHYYEAHVMIEPISSSRFEKLEKICLAYNFRLARFTMIIEGEQAKQFASSRNPDLITIMKDTKFLVRELLECDFKIQRYKIESTLVDSNDNDEMLLFVK